MTAALEGGEWSAARSGRTLPPGKTLYSFYRRLGGPQSRSERAENLVPTGIRSQTVHPVVSCYTDWAIRLIYISEIQHYPLHTYVVRGLHTALSPSCESANWLNTVACWYEQKEGFRWVSIKRFCCFRLQHTVKCSINMTLKCTSIDVVLCLSCGISRIRTQEFSTAACKKTCNVKVMEMVNLWGGKTDWEIWTFKSHWFGCSLAFWFRFLKYTIN